VAKVISAVNSQTSINITGGPTGDDALKGWTAVMFDAILDAGFSKPATAVVSAYTASSGLVTFANAPVRTISTNDVAFFLPPDMAAVWPTTFGRTLDISSGGEAGIDWANVGTPGSTVSLSATTVGTATALGSAYDLYSADIQFQRDEANTQDEYTVTWFKNGVRQTSGITSPTIQVINRSDGSNLIASTAMTQIGTTGSYKYDEATNRLTAGEAAVAVVSGTIDGSARTFSRIVGRDSTA
jgi:hypothetical protein